MLSAIAAGALLAGPGDVTAHSNAGRTELTLHGNTIHTTQDTVSKLRTLHLAGGEVVALWNEAGESRYAISLDGRSVQRTAQAKKTLEFQYQAFDPKESIPNIPDRLRARRDSNLFVVQFETQSLSEYRDAIKAAGGEIVSYIPNNAHVVRMDAATREEIESMAFVRYIGNYEPAFRIDPVVIRRLTSNLLGTTRYNILLTDYAPGNKYFAAGAIRGVGGIVHEYEQGGRLIEATLTPDQLVAVASMNNVLWVDLWGPMEPDLNIVRQFHGTNTLENATGLSGEGVRGLVRDTELRTTHQDFQLHPPIVILPGNPDDWHGTATFGIIFGSGAGNANARGVMPDAQGVFIGGLTTGATRFNQTQSAINNHQIVFETNSMGSNRVTTYTTNSANMDDIIFDLNILIGQSQSNAGNQMSRPEAWAKNIVSVGGINHQNTLTRADDLWNDPNNFMNASIGPASDGRLKPDLASFYDWTWTTWSSGNNQYITDFGGTSGATPIVMGHSGLIFQLWSEGVFNNSAYGTDVFTSKPNAMTAKALLINRAEQWTFAGAGDDKSRYKQGWGNPQIDATYAARDKAFIVDQTDVLAELGAKTYRLYVPAGEPSFRATMCYRDLPGNPAVQSQHRVNDLTLKVTDPGGNVYWGNNGLAANMWSPTGGVANTKDTVEIVQLLSPAQGVWTVEVSAPEINGDTHPQTQGVDDADYALVVTGVSGAMALPTMSETLETGSIESGTVADTHHSDNDKFVVKPGVILVSSQWPIRYVREVMAPTTVGDIWVSTEASVSENNVDERVELWNFTTGQWNVIATHTGVTNTDSARTVLVTDPTNYVDGSMHIRTRVSYKANGPVLLYPYRARIDHVRVYFAP